MFECIFYYVYTYKACITYMAHIRSVCSDTSSWPKTQPLSLANIVSDHGIPDNILKIEENTMPMYIYIYACTTKKNNTEIKRTYIKQQWHDQ